MCRVRRVLLLQCLLTLPFAAIAADDTALLAKAREIHKRIVAFDSHTDIALDFEGAAIDGKSQLDLPKWRVAD